jgi:hypothetical protein
MSRRAHLLHESADHQIAQLAGKLSAAGRTGLGRPCPGREKLGDGTVAAVAAHVTDNYQRIARFVAGLEDRGMPYWPDRHRASEIDPRALLARLAAARDGLAAIGRLSDEELDLVPPASEMKFVDGQRTVEQIVASLLKHQRHQIAALTSALS